jgi:hypothetical protein
MQMLAYASKANVDDDLIQHLDDRDVEVLRKVQAQTSSWMSGAVCKMSAARHG